MYDFRFKICRKGSWTWQLSKKFKGDFTSHTTFGLNKSDTSDILHILSSDNLQFPKILSFLKKHKIVKSIDLLFEDEENLYVQIYSNVSKIRSLIGTINKEKGFVLKPIILKDGYEYWTVTIPSKENLETLIENIKLCGDFEMISVLSSSLDNANLTKNQREILKAAFEFGYYDFPRKITATDLSKKLKTSKSNFLQHLRVAESKIMSDAVHSR